MQMVHSLSDHELNRLLKHLKLYMELLDKHYSNYNPNAHVCDLMEDADILRSRIRAILEVEDNMTVPSFECPPEKFSRMIGWCVYRAEAIHKSSVKFIAFVPHGNEWAVELHFQDGTVWKGKHSLSKGESLMSLHTLITNRIESEVNHLQLVLDDNFGFETRKSI